MPPDADLDKARAALRSWSVAGRRRRGHARRGADRGPRCREPRRHRVVGEEAALRERAQQRSCASGRARSETTTPADLQARHRVWRNATARYPFAQLMSARARRRPAALAGVGRQEDRCSDSRSCSRSSASRVAGVGLWVLDVARRRAPSIDELKPARQGRELHGLRRRRLAPGLRPGRLIREQVDLDEIPKKLQQATIAIEDENFYEHDGVDYRRSSAPRSRTSRPARSSRAARRSPSSSSATSTSRIPRTRSSARSARRSWRARTRRSTPRTGSSSST